MSGQFVYYLTEIWRVSSEVSPGIFRIMGCASKKRLLVRLEQLAPATIRTDVTDLRKELADLKNECSQLRVQAEQSALKMEVEELRAHL